MTFTTTAQPAPAPGSDLLSTRLLQVLEMTALGATNSQMATRLGVGDETVKTHMKRLMAALGARSRAEAVGIGYRMGLLPVPGQTRDPERDDVGGPRSAAGRADEAERAVPPTGSADAPDSARAANSARYASPARSSQVTNPMLSARPTYSARPALPTNTADPAAPAQPVPPMRLAPSTGSPERAGAPDGVPRAVPHAARSSAALPSPTRSIPRQSLSSLAPPLQPSTPEPPAAPLDPAAAEALIEVARSLVAGRPVSRTRIQACQALVAAGRWPVAA